MLKLAFKFILYDKPKSFGALLGIVISTFLIGQQSGIFLFLTGSMSRLVDNIPAALWVVDSKTTNVNAMGQIDMRITREIESIAGVARVYPLVIASSSARLPDGKTSGITLVGSQAPHFRGGPWNITDGKIENLLNDGCVSTDYFDRRALSFIKVGDIFEIGGKKVQMGLYTKGARGFGGIYVFTTIDRARFLGKVPPNKVSALLVDLEQGVDTLAVREKINTAIYGVKAWTNKDFSRSTVATVLSSSGIAISIGTMIVFAIISGLVIIGLTLYSAAIDRIKDYGTMKAIGATNAYITKLILLQAFILALIGYAIALVLLELFRSGIANAGTIFAYTPLMRLAFFGITLTLSLTGSLFAIFRIRKIEPASVFRL